jgi:hypothetical protein
MPAPLHFSFHLSAVSFEFYYRRGCLLLGPEAVFIDWGGAIMPFAMAQSTQMSRKFAMTL